jgi:NADPH-ferrihemoprotein reductase
MEARKFVFFFLYIDVDGYMLIRTRQYKLIRGPFPPENVFTGEIGRLKSYEKQKPYVYLFCISKNQRILFFFNRPFDLRNPYLAPVIASRELFQKDCRRSCLHLELDISNTRIK